MEFEMLISTLELKSQREITTIFVIPQHLFMFDEIQNFL